MFSFRKCTVCFVLLATAIGGLAVFLKLRRGDTMSCIFCNIVNKKTDTELLHEDENFVAFKDIKPASQFHYLIIPKKHIQNTNALTIADKQMVTDMKRIMLQLLELSNQTDQNEISLGFHVPPFNSVKHLHLHGISPKSDMKFVGRWIFRENSYWYKTPDTIINSLKESS